MKRMSRKGLRAFAAAAFLLTLLLASLILYAHFLIQRPAVHKVLVDYLAGPTGYSIETGPIEISLWGGLGVEIQDFQAVSPQGGQRIRAESVHLVLEPAELLRGRVIPVSLSLVRPRMDLRVPERTPGTALEDPLPVPWLSGLQRLSVEQGKVSLRDRPFSLEDLNLQIRSGEGVGLKLSLSSTGSLLHEGLEAPFRVRGTVVPPGDGGAYGPFDLFVQAGIPAAWIPWPDELSFEAGHLDAALTLRGSPGDPLAAGGRITFSGARFTLLQPERQKAYAPPALNLAFTVQADEEYLRARDMTLNTGDISLRLDLEMKKRGGRDPLISLAVESDPMDIRTFERYFPTPLIAPWVEHELFPLLASGETRLESLTLQGTPGELRELDEPENAGAFSMAVKCGDFELAGGAIPLPFKEVDALVTYRGGDLLVTGLRAGFEGCTIREGRLEVRGLLEEHTTWDALVDGDFSLQPLMKQKAMDFIPPDALQELNRLGPVEGLLSCSAWFRYEKGWDFPRTRKGLFVVRDGRIHQPELLLPMYLDQAEIRVREEEQNTFKAEGAWGETSFQAEGAFGKGARAFPLHTAEVSAWVDMNQTLPLFLGGFRLPLAFEDKVFTRFSVDRAGPRWSCKGSMDLEGVTLRNEAVSMRPPGPEDRIRFHLLAGPGGELEGEISCRLRGSVLEGSGGYDPERKDSLSFRIASSGLDLEDLGLRFGDGARPTRGRITGDLKVMGSRKDPFSTLVLGRLEGEGIYVDLDALPSEVKEASFDLDFSGKTVTVNHCRMRVGESDLEVEGELKGWRRVRGRLSVGADFLDPKDFLPRNDLEASDKGLPRNLHLRLDISARETRLKELKFGPLRAEARLSDGDFELARARVRLEHGVLTSSGRIRTGPDPEISLANHIRLTEQPVAGLLEDLGIETSLEQGILNLEAYLTMNGEKLSELLPSLGGNADVSIREGVIRNSSVFVRILDMLSLRKVFKRKPAGLPEDAFYFERMEGFAVIQRGTLETENFTMKSPVYNAVAAGKAHLAERQVNFTLGIQPMETLDTLVSKIPIVGYALTGKDRSFITYYFEVEGPMSEPSVRHVPFKHLGGGVAGALKRLFLSPLRLYNGLPGNSGVSREKSDPGAGRGPP